VRKSPITTGMRDGAASIDAMIRRSSAGRSAVMMNVFLAPKIGRAQKGKNRR
jgi:hypothetical protein